MKFEAIKCDECGALKGETNHWIMIIRWTLKGVNVGLTVGEIDVMPVSDYTAANRIVQDLCGQACAMKYIAKALGWTPTTTL